MLLIAGSNGLMALKVAKISGIQFSHSQIGSYPDGEKYFRFAQDVEGEEVVIFNSMHPNPADTLFETLLIADTAYDCGAKAVICVFPYFAYARVLSSLKGEANPIKTVVKLLHSARIEKIITVDFHLQENVFGIEHVDLTGMEKLAEYCLEEFTDDFTVIAPDEKAAYWAEKFARKAKKDFFALKKIRIDAENVIIDELKRQVEGDVIIVDDIVSTAGTVCQAARIAKKAGARRVFVACSHAILAGDAMTRIIESGIEDIVSTDTVLSPVSHVSVADVLASALSF